MLPRKEQLNFSRKIVIGVMACLVVVFLLTGWLAPRSARAQGPAPGAADTFGLQPVEQATILSTADIRVIVAKIIRAVLGLLGLIALVIILYAGYVIMTSGGNAERVETGKKILINATIGLAIILSSFTIVQFVLNAFTRATGLSAPALGPGAGPARQTYASSGALGRIVKDHYPLRDQKEVARNTKITVTFREPIDPASLITNTNGSVDAAGKPILGDCVNINRPNFRWDTDCDRLISAAVRVSEKNKPNQPLDMAALAVGEGTSQQFFTFVFRPLQALGSDIQPVGYQVELTNNILKADPRKTPAFQNTRSRRYVWEFETGTSFDFTPPVVESVYPAAAERAPRNSIVQINFNEPMDPTVVQGLANPASPFYHILFADQRVTGEWRVTNGYKTVEFVSDQSCGQDSVNSCGQPMFCLPVACPPGTAGAGGACAVAPYQVLVRTAALQGGGGKFEAIPFSGAADMAGNALNGDDDKPPVPDGKPTMPSNLRTIGGNESNPDNYLWNFVVENRVDREAPYIEKVGPGIDEEAVAGNAAQTIIFSKPMWFGTLSDIAIEEHGLPAPPVGQPPVAPLWFSPRASVASNKTTVAIAHRVFGPNNQAAYYFTSIPSTVQSVTQNCLYPGRGPVAAVKGAAPTCVCATDQNTGAVTCSASCVAVTNDQTKDTGCVQTSRVSDQLQPDVNMCLGRMRALSP